HPTTDLFLVAERVPALPAPAGVSAAPAPAHPAQPAPLFISVPASSPGAQVTLASPAPDALARSGYHPLGGKGVNLAIDDGLYYTPPARPGKRPTVNAHVPTPSRQPGDYKVRLYWAATPSLFGRTQVAGEKTVHFARFGTEGGDNVTFSASEVTAQPG